MIIGTSEDISVSKMGPIGGSAWALSLDEWFWLVAKWAISVFRFIKMPFFSPSFWTWLQLGASTISYFFQVLLLKIISKFLFFMASMYLALVQTGHHCYFWDFLNLHSVPFLFYPLVFFNSLTSGWFQIQNSIHHLNHKLDTAYPCYDSLKIAYWHVKNLSGKVHQNCSGALCEVQACGIQMP